MNLFNRRQLLKTAVALALAAVTGIAVAGTPQEIQTRKKLLVAIDLSVPPFGMTDAQLQPQGADVDVARLLAKDLGVALEIVQVTGPNRIPFLMTGKADIVISSFSITPERAKVVAFSTPYSANQLVVGAPKEKAITGLADLTGKRVAVVRGNLQDLELTRLAPAGTTLVRYEDDATANTALIAGQVDALCTPSTTIQTLATRHPGKKLETKFVVKVQPLAIGLRKEDTALAGWINSWVNKNLDNGKLGEIYTKWMSTPLPDVRAIIARNG